MRSDPSQLSPLLAGLTLDQELAGLRPGSSRDDVRSVLGAPESWLSSPSADESPIWYYGSLSIRFDRRDVCSLNLIYSLAGALPALPASLEELARFGRKYPDWTTCLEFVNRVGAGPVEILNGMLMDQPRGLRVAPSLYFLYSMEPGPIGLESIRLTSCHLE